jgi:hypothetical protein
LESLPKFVGRVPVEDRNHQGPPGPDREAAPERARLRYVGTLFDVLVREYRQRYILVLTPERVGKT